MGIFHKRHLALFCFIFAAASIGSCFFNPRLRFILLLSLSGLLALLIPICVFIKRRKAAALKAFLCILFACLAFLSHVTRIDRPINQINELIGEKASLSATVRSIDICEDFVSVYMVEIDRLNDTKVNLKAILECEYNAELELGERIYGKANINSIANYSEAESYYLARGIALYLNNPEEITSMPCKTDISTRFAMLNQRLSRTIAEHLDEDESDFISALSLGNKDKLDDGIIRDFRRAGLSHILAISGLHLSILMFFIDFLLKKIKINKTARGVTVIILALFYLALTGFALSTVRAFLMTSMVYFAFVANDESDMLTNLFCSLFVILIVQPYSVYDIGLWLSFLAVLGIFVAQYFIQALSDILYSKYAKDKKQSKYKLNKGVWKLTTGKIRIIIYVFSSVLITLFANIFICVPAWLYFDEISLISVISNLIASPLITLILYIVPVYIVTGFAPILHSFLGSILNLLAKIMLWLSTCLSGFGKITVSLNYPLVGVITVLLAIALSLCLVFKLKRKWIIIIPPLIASLALCGVIAVDKAYYSNVVQIEYIGGQESEMILLRDANDFSIIDVSSGGSAHAQNAYNLSLKNSATEISSYVITHYHSYHKNSIRKMLKKAIVKRLCLPYPQNIDEYYTMCGLITEAQGEGTDVIIYDPNSSLTLGENTSFEISPRYVLKRSSHPTLYFSITAHDQRFTYLGESIFEDKEAEAELLGAINTSRFILFGCHGPKTKFKEAYPIHLNNQSVVFANEEIETAFNFTANDETEFISNAIYCRFYISENENTGK